LYTRVAEQRALPSDFETDPQTHDKWFRGKVREALDDMRPAVLHEDVEAHFARRRAAAFQRRPNGSTPDNPVDILA